MSRLRHELSGDVAHISTGEEAATCWKMIDAGVRDQVSVFLQFPWPGLVGEGWYHYGPATGLLLLTSK